MPYDNSRSGAIIFHPHGLISTDRRRGGARDCELILSEEDYHALNSNPYSWANLVQLTLLMNHSCLFVGISLTNPNLRRLLDVCGALGLAHRHYAIVSHSSLAVEKPGRHITRAVREAVEAEYLSVGVEPVRVDAFGDITGVFDAIRVDRAGAGAGRKGGARCHAP